MSIDLSLLLVILGCALVTFVPRIAPFVLIRNLRLPQPLLKFLNYIPICLLTALIVQGVLVKSGSGVSIDWHTLIIIIPTLLIALKTKSLLLTVLAGIVSAAIVRFIF
ncbi:MULTISPECIES: AzlD domain-containing protein [Bacillales]|uniref:AzlD domain-containing protein n=1 Tax=Bacillales TaxID=1385 RepID=UPI0006A7EB1A|nr:MULTISPECIES: AzlD domain-containing protein [Bacillales]OBZ15182.1 branched-chain amino acid transporter AzlD [Bacillus sp. FJAT-26390]